MDEELNVAANVEETATPPITEENTSSENTEVTAEPTEPKQDVTETQAFSQRLKESTQKGIDAHYEKMYGVSNGIHNEAEFNAAMAKQEAEQQAQTYKDAGYDQEMINKMINENPTVMQANSIIQKQTEDNRINGEIAELFAEFPESKDSKIPDSVFIESMNKGISLMYAYSRYANKNAVAIAEQKTLRGLQQNAQTSPGALGSGQQPLKSDYSTMSSKDFENIVQKIQRGEKIN